MDLSQNRHAALGITVVGAGLLVVAGGLLLRFVAVTRPHLESSSFQVGVAEALLLLPALVALMAVTMLVHEGLHGLGYWLITRQRPAFGFRGLYAYAAAPGWYIPRLSCVLVGLVPLIGVTAVGMALLPAVPAGAVPAVFLATVLNAAGSAGDLIAAVWLLTRPPATLVCDTGDAPTLYQPAPPDRREP